MFATAERHPLKSPGGGSCRSTSCWTTRICPGWLPSRKKSPASSSSGSTRAAAETNLRWPRQRPCPVFPHQDALGRRAGPGGFYLHRPWHGNPQRAPLLGRGAPQSLGEAPRVRPPHRARCHCLGTARLDRAERVLTSWRGQTISDAEKEILTLQLAVDNADWETLEPHGGPRCRHEEDPPIRAAKPELQRPWNDRRFPPLGVKQMPSYGCHPFRGGGVTLRGDMLLTTTTPFSQRADPSPLWVGTFPKRRMGRGITRIPASHATKRSEASPRVSPLARRDGAPHERGCWWRERPPFFDRWCGTGEG